MNVKTITELSNHRDREVEVGDENEGKTSKQDILVHIAVSGHNAPSNGHKELPVKRRGGDLGNPVNHHTVQHGSEDEAVQDEAEVGVDIQNVVLGDFHPVDKGTEQDHDGGQEGEGLGHVTQLPGTLAVVDRSPHSQSRLDEAIDQTNGLESSDESVQLHVMTEDVHRFEEEITTIHSRENENSTLNQLGFGGVGELPQNQNASVILLPVSEVERKNTPDVVHQKGIPSSNTSSVQGGDESQSNKQRVASMVKEFTKGRGRS